MLFKAAISCRYWLFLAIITTSFLSASFAQTPAYSMGKAEVEYEGWSVAREVKDKAVIKAKENALRSYFSGRSDTDAKRFDAVEREIFTNLDYYLINSSVLGDAVFSDRKKYSVTVQVQLNLNRLNQKLVPDAKSSKGEKPELAFLFITRQLVEQQKFDDRVYKRNDSSQTISGSINARESGREGETIRNGNVSTNANVQRNINGSINISNVSESGGSVTTKAAKRTYKLSSSGTFNTAFLERLTAQDWPYDPIELETEPTVKLDLVKKDYASNEEIQPENLQKLLSDAREAGFKYLALGTLNVSLPAHDSEVELQRVSVEINAKVYEIGSRRIKTILTVQPTLVSGFDRDDVKAQSKAIREAALRSAKEFLSQLSNKVIAD